MPKLSSLLQLIIKPQAHSLKLQSIRAAIWSLLEKGSSQALRMIGSLILTRLLFPTAFGIMATAQIIIVMIQLFTDIGIRVSIIQNPKGAEPEFLNTAWIISICRGLVLCVALIALAWPLSMLYEQPEIKTILLIMSLIPFIQGFENPALSVIIKTFRVEKKVALELGSQALGLFSTILLAWLMRSVYALAIGIVLSTTYKVIGSFMVTTLRPSFNFHREYGQQIFNLGKYIFLNTLVSFLALNADTLIIGKVLHMADLGVYSVGRNIGTLIWMICFQVFVQAYLPAVSSVQNDKARVQRIYEKTTMSILVLVIPVSLIMAFLSQDIIRLLYDPRYINASISMFWFCLTGILLILNGLNTNTFIAMGKVRYETLSMAITLVCVMLVVPMAAQYYHIRGAAFAMFTTAGLMVMLQSSFLITAVGLSFKKILQPIVLISGSMGITAGTYYVLRPIIPSGFLLDIPFFLLIGLTALITSLGLFCALQRINPLHYNFLSVKKNLHA